MEKNLEPLNGNERVALAALCGLEDAGMPVTAIEAARWLDMPYFEVHPRVTKLRRKGWVVDGRRYGKATLLSIVARPLNVEKRYGYRSAVQSCEIERHPDDVPAVRECLSCGRDFESEGFGNRRCKRCKKSEESDGAWMGEIGAPS